MTPQEIKDKIGAHRQDLREMGVASLALFGSVARHEATAASDLDFLVEFDRPVGLFQLIRVQQYLEDTLEVERVDMVMPDALREEFREEVLQEAVRVG